MADKYFRIFGYPVSYHFYGVTGFIFARYSDIPEDFEIFDRYRDAFADLLDFELGIPLSYYDRQGDRDV